MWRLGGPRRDIDPLPLAPNLGAKRQLKAKPPIVAKCAREARIIGIGRSRGRSNGRGIHHDDAGAESRESGEMGRIERQDVSDTMGVDFSSYLARLKLDVRRNWYNLVPEVARPPLRKTGKVTIDSGGKTIALDGYATLPVVLKSVKREGK